MQFVNQQALYHHMFHRHVRYTRKYIACGFCRDKMPTMEAAERHLSAHLGGRCPFCDVPVRSNVTRHLLEEHDNTGCFSMEFICDFCPYKSESVTSLQLHCLLCTNNPKNENYVPTEEGKLCWE